MSADNQIGNHKSRNFTFREHLTLLTNLLNVIYLKKFAQPEICALATHSAVTF